MRRRAGPPSGQTRRGQPGAGRAAATLAALAIACSAQAAAAGQEGPAPPPPARQESTAEAPAAAGPVVGADVTVASAFMWRGFELFPSPVVQPSIWVGIGPITIVSWSNIETPSPGRATYSEHDLTVDYSREVGPATVSVGWTHYAFVQESTDRFTNEFYLAVSAGGYLNPRVQVVQDVHAGSGTYALFEMSHEFAVGGTGVLLTPTLTIGYTDRQWVDWSGFSHITASVGATVPLGRSHASLHPFLAYSHGLDADLFPRRFYAGLTFTVE